MTEIFLDGKRAVATDNANWKLTMENPYFTKSSSYSYEIELPMALPENREIFGAINRLDFPKEGRTLAARLVVDNHTVLVGDAKITSVTESSVKVQLLGGESAYNNNGDKYIDELDMGDWGWRTWPDGSWPRYNRGTKEWEWITLEQGQTMCASSYDVIQRVKRNNPGEEELTEMQLIAKLRSGVFPWVAYPTFNRTCDTRCNVIAYEAALQAVVVGEQAEIRLLRAPYFRGYDGEKPSTPNPEAEGAAWSTAIQPFVWMMCELVAEATGFKLERADNYLFTNNFFKKIFIVNTCTSGLCAKSLPHWTVNEWWTQVEHTFGVVVSVDCATRSMRLYNRSEHYRSLAATISLQEVVDDYSADVSDEAEKDIAINNVGFSDFEAVPGDLLPEDVMKLAMSNKVDGGENLTDLLQWARLHTDDLQEMKGNIFECRDGRQYIYTTNAIDDEVGFLEINMLRPRMQNIDSEDVEIELKMVPAKIANHLVDIFQHHERGPHGFIYADTPISTFDALMLEVEGVNIPRTGESDSLDLQAVVEDEDDAEVPNDSKLDKLFLAISDNTLIDTYEANVTFDNASLTGDFEFPRAHLRERQAAKLNGNPVNLEPGGSLSLVPTPGLTNLASETIANAVSIDTKSRHCIKFVADIMPDPKNIFLIHNRRFVCQKLEVSINSKGFSKLVTGYFYELTL